MVLEVAVGQTIWANNRVPVCPEPSHRVPRLRPDTRIHQLKRNDTRLDGTARYHSEHSDNAEVASSILASPTVKSLFRATNPRSAAHRLSWHFWPGAESESFRRPVDRMSRDAFVHIETGRDIERVNSGATAPLWCRCRRPSLITGWLDNRCSGLLARGHEAPEGRGDGLWSARRRTVLL